MLNKLIKLFRGQKNLGDEGGLATRLHIDSVLLALILLVALFGFFVLYSASNQSTALLTRQVIRFGIALGAMFVVAQIPPKFLRIWAPILFLIGLSMLIAVKFAGDVGKGAQRWLDLGLIRFQPSELMKLAVPMMVAWYLHFRPLPAKFGVNMLALGMIIVPTALISIQPDLGTALLIAASGVFVILLAGLSLRFILLSGVIAMIAAPAYWFTLMQD
ncbi:MAG: FtsW/RodA/SpoVE family cell cycle protein, partial [Gammaproteobacteria bacterium]|nr:FtsW/RodA/SpoVE family cell cycle protein [Gammaproteobacteria bacterium]